MRKLIRGRNADRCVSGATQPSENTATKKISDVCLRSQNGRKFLDGACTPRHTIANFHDPPPHNSRIVSPLPPVAASVRTGQTMYYQLRLLDPSNEASHKLIELVVEAVAYAVDVT
jgi:hypothetical protein